MRDKNLDAYQDQDDTPEEARLQPTGDGQTETAAKPGTEQTEEDRHRPDNHQRNRQLRGPFIACTDKRYADGQRINTRGHSQHQLGTKPIGIKELFLFGTKGLTNHITTDT